MDDKDLTIAVKGHTLRLNFEKVALWTIVAVVIFGCLVGFASASLAARVVQLKDSVMDFLTVLGGMVGVTLTRGHMDQRLAVAEDK